MTNGLISKKPTFRAEYNLEADQHAERIREQIDREENDRKKERKKEPIMNYYHKHALVALAIASFIWLCLAYFLGNAIALTAGCFSGAFFYIGREYVQFEKYEPEFDWPGLLWPVSTMLLIFIVVIYETQL